MWHIGDIEIVPRNYALVVNGYLWTSLAFMFVVMRLYTRAIIVKRLGWDDWLMTAAMVSFRLSRIASYVEGRKAGRICFYSLFACSIYV